MSPTIPTFEDLSFYANSEKAQQLRYDALASQFHTNFPSSKIDFFARSPGRVNLIGDHIDYNYFPVLPMAIDVDVVAAVSVNQEEEEDDEEKEKEKKDHASVNNSIVITNTKSDEFPREVIALPKEGEEIKMDEHHGWANYFRCALIVAHKYLQENSKKSTLVSTSTSSSPISFKLRGMKMCFDGSVPTGGGLSSSAAFCVTATLAILYAAGVTNLSKADLTRITVVSEHYIGLNNGGMDQCASVNGETGHAMAIAFKPQLKATPVQFPVEDLTFIITNSLQVSNKHETAPVHYNLRVVEMAIASDLLAKKLGVEDKAVKDSNLSTTSLRSIMDAYLGEWNGDDVDQGIANVKKMIDEVERYLKKGNGGGNHDSDGYTVAEVSQQLQITETEFQSKYLSKFPVRFEKLQLYQRAKHVYRESLRVLQTLKLLQQQQQQQQSQGSDNEFLSKFGQLMNESQQDLDQLNQSSNDKLNEICQLALRNGSYGSRVTGAGWGGSIVHLTTVDKLPHLTKIFKEYFKKEFPGVQESELAEAIIDSQPAMGSCIIKHVK